VSTTLTGVETQMKGITVETTELLHKTNALAVDIQKKSESLNSVVDSVRQVGNSIQGLNTSISRVSTTVTEQTEANKDKIAQVVQWSNVAMDIWNKVKGKRNQQQNQSPQIEEENVPKRSRMYM
jgi:uncharacterized protein YoxC